MKGIRSIETRAGRDDVVIEEPLELRVSGETFAVTMRTPGHDRELALGLLFSEGIIDGTSDVLTLAHCGRTTDEGRENSLEITLAPGKSLPDEQDRLVRRGTLTSSACGVCGRTTIDDLLRRIRAVPLGATTTRTTLLRAVAQLRDHQPLFARTGGCHGAALATLDGAIVSAFEDVGRHNAVDKLVGRALLDGRVPLRDRALLVSGRASFELVQKAAAAGIGTLVAVGAASSLAIDLAARANVTLLGFARGETATVYVDPGRLVG